MNSEIILDIEQLISSFNEHIINDVQHNENKQEASQNNFLNKFNAVKVANMTMEDYVYDTDYELQKKRHTFCNIIATDMTDGSVGQRPQVWGYYRTNETIKNSRKEIVRPPYSEFNAFKEGIYNLLAAGSNENYEEIRNNYLTTNGRNLIAIRGKILGIYYPEKYLPIYKEDNLVYYLEKLGLSLDGDVLDKQQRLIAWKNSNAETKDWSNYIFEAFLVSMLGTPELSRKKTSKIDKNEIEKQTKAAETQADNELIDEINSTEKPMFTSASTGPKPRAKVIIVGGRAVYPRSRETANNALRNADFKCEMATILGEEHPTFIRKSNGLNYTEPHHLIPMSQQYKYSQSLDHEANIVSLCSNCHNEIHYGENYADILEFLYEERKSALEAAGLEIKFDELLSMYQ